MDQAAYGNNYAGAGQGGLGYDNGPGFQPQMPNMTDIAAPK